MPNPSLLGGFHRASGSAAEHVFRYLFKGVLRVLVKRGPGLLAPYLHAVGYPHNHDIPLDLCIFLQVFRDKYSPLLVTGNFTRSGKVEPVEVSGFAGRKWKRFKLGLLLLPLILREYKETRIKAPSDEKSFHIIFFEYLSEFRGNDETAFPVNAMFVFSVEHIPLYPLSPTLWVAMGK